MKSIVDKAIVLRRINYGDSDRILTLLCQRNGKITAFAKGVRKQKSRLSGGVELLSRSEITFVKGKSDLVTLTSVRLIENFSNIVKDMGRINFCYDALKILDKICEDGTGQEYFEELNILLDYMNRKEYDADIVKAWFDLKVMKLSGVSGKFTVSNNHDTHGSYTYDEDKDLFVRKDSGRFSEREVKLMNVLSNSRKPVLISNQVDTALVQIFLQDQLKERLT